MEAGLDLTIVYDDDLLLACFLYGFSTHHSPAQNVPIREVTSSFLYSKLVWFDFVFDFLIWLLQSYQGKGMQIPVLQSTHIRASCEQAR